MTVSLCNNDSPKTEAGRHGHCPGCRNELPMVKLFRHAHSQDRQVGGKRHAIARTLPCQNTALEVQPAMPASRPQTLKHPIDTKLSAAGPPASAENRPYLPEHAAARRSFGRIAKVDRPVRRRVAAQVEVGHLPEFADYRPISGRSPLFSANSGRQASVLARIAEPGKTALSSRRAGFPIGRAMAVVPEFNLPGRLTGPGDFKASSLCGIRAAGERLLRDSWSPALPPRPTGSLFPCGRRCCPAAWLR